MEKVDFIINSYKDKVYYKDGDLHREDGPAIEWLDGSKFYYLNNKCHRLDGPAAIWANGQKKWYIDGSPVKANCQEDFLRSEEYRKWKLKVFW